MQTSPTPMPHQLPHEIFGYLDRLDEVFDQELAALAKLDRKAIEGASESKLRLDRQLQSAIGEYAQAEDEKDPEIVALLQKRLETSRTKARNNLNVLESYSRQIQHLRNKLTGTEASGYHPRGNRGYQKQAARPLLTDSVG